MDLNANRAKYPKMESAPFAEKKFPAYGNN